MIDELEIFRRYQKTKDINLRNEIALNNISLVHYAIKNIFVPNHNDYEELEQEGFIGLLKAIENFNPNLGFKFSSFAYKYILSASRFRLDYNKDTSLDEPVKNKSIGDPDDIELIDTIEDTTIDIPRDVENESISERIKKILTKDEYTCINLFYKYDFTLKEIAKYMNISVHVLYRIRNKAIIKIKGNPYFQSYKNEIEKENNISYLKAYDYSVPRVQSSNISNPVWEILLEREKLENKIIKQALIWAISDLKKNR